MRGNGVPHNYQEREGGSGQSKAKTTHPSLPSGVRRIQRKNIRFLATNGHFWSFWDWGDGEGNPFPNGTGYGHNSLARDVGARAREQPRGAMLLCDGAPYRPWLRNSFALGE